MVHRSGGQLEEDGVPGISTLAAARAHARSLAGEDSPTARTTPSTTAIDLPEGVAAADVLWDEVIGPGGYASRALPRGAILRITDTEGDACVQLLVYDAANPAERLNVADTVKVQWQAYLGRGALLLSDMGRVLLTVVDDTSERHDCLCGSSTAAANAARYGDGLVSGPSPAARDLLCLGVAKHGLSRADVGPNVNLFKSARVAPDGALRLDGEPVPGAYVELRAELPVLVVLADSPHPIDDRPSYRATPVRCTAWCASHPDPDPCRATSPERQRAFENADEHRRVAPA
jgi:urea carboxylase-associated protein 2